MGTGYDNGIAKHRIERENKYMKNQLHRRETEKHKTSKKGEKSMCKHILQFIQASR